MKIVVIILIIAILIALFSSFIGLNIGGKKGSDRMFKSLATRVGLSVLLFVLLMFSGYMGWIKPNPTNFHVQPAPSANVSSDAQVDVKK